jgi:PKD repeat protein
VILAGTDTQASDAFGISVAVEGDRAIVGAGSDSNIRGFGAGAAYVFDLPSLNADPIVEAGDDQLITDGDAISLDPATFTDADTTDIHSALIDWGDGSAAEAGAVSEANGSGTVAGTHTYAAPGTYTVTVTVDDGQGGTGGDTFMVVVGPFKLLADDGGAADEFGTSVAIGDGVVVVGAPFDDQLGTDAGAIYVFEVGPTGQWLQAQKLTASGGAAGDNFGFSVAIDGARFVVGSPLDDGIGSNSGSVHVFEHASPWTQVATLTASDAATNDRFGSSVAIDGDRIVVGSPLDDAPTNAGAIYVFDWTGSWTQTKVRASDAAANDEFGRAVGVDGDRIVVGAALDDTPGTNAGSAYVFDKVGPSWVQTKLARADGAAGDEFGFSVAVSGNVVVVGAYLDDDLGTSSGSAYVYEWDGLAWQSDKLLAGDGVAGDRFGRAVVVDGARLLVGAPWDQDGGARSGSVHAYTRQGLSSWTSAKVLPFDGQNGDRFAMSLDLFGDRIAAGATLDDDLGTSAGSAYVISIPPISTDLTADAGGPYVVDEGSSVQLDATGSVDPDGSITAYSWAPAGQLDDPTLAQPTYTGADDDVEVLTLTVTGSDLATDFDTTAVTVQNVAPSVTGGADQLVVLGTGAQLAPATFTDPGLADTHTAEIDWGDGTVEPGLVTQGAGSGSVAGSHEYDGVGSFVVTVTVHDDDGGSASDTLTVTVAPAKLLASDGSASDLFGRAVAISGDRAVVGAHQNEQLGTNAGAAYVFERQPSGHWLETARLTASDGAAGDNFGYAVAIDGDRIVVGAYLEDNALGSNAGALYIYEWTGSAWQGSKVVASDGGANDQLGIAVGVSGDRVVGGANLYDAPGQTNKGAAYVFGPDGLGGWQESGLLLAPDPIAQDRFGIAVGVSGDRVVVGAHQADSPGAANAGSVYVFDHNGSTWDATKLVRGDPAANDEFGIAVGVSGDRVVVGAHLDDDNGTDSGSVYVFDLGGGSWVPTKVTAPDGLADDRFGISVAVEGDLVVAGASLDDNPGANRGSAYAFTAAGGGAWSELKLAPLDSANQDRFGVAVGVSTGRILVGSYQDDDLGSNSGSAHVFDVGG